MDEFAEIALTATERKCWSIYTSYGIWSEVLPYMKPQEQLKLQTLNLFFYNIAVSRVMTTIILKMVYFAQNVNTLIEYNPCNGQTKTIDLRKF